MCCDGFGTAFEEFGFDDSSSVDRHHAEGAIFVAHWKRARGAHGYEVDFAGWKIGDVWSSAAKAVAFLGFLLSEIETQRRLMPQHFVVDLHPVGASHSEPQFFSGAADLIVVHGESGL